MCNAELQKDLAINGGTKTITTTQSARHHFGEEERAAALRVIDSAIALGEAPGYGGPEEEAFGKEFSELLGGGYADAVNSGSTAVFVALRALELEPFSEVIVGPITDPGGIMPIVMCNCIPVIADSATDSFNMDVNTIKAVFTERTSAIVIPHISGEPVDMEPIIEFAKANNLKVVEDCAQAHGAKINGKSIGTFGDIAAYSLMFGKHTCTGGQGGMVFTKCEDLYWKVRQNSDRGKPFGLPAGSSNCVASLNFNLDEVGCAIGRVQTKKMFAIAEGRREVVAKLMDGIKDVAAIRLPKVPANIEHSYWFLRLILDTTVLTCDKGTFCSALSAEGLSVASSYDAVPYMGDWAQKKNAFGTNGFPWTATDYKGDHNMKYTLPANISKVRQDTIILYPNESWTCQDITDAAIAINKVYNAYKK